MGYWSWLRNLFTKEIPNFFLRNGEVHLVVGAVTCLLSTLYTLATAASGEPVTSMGFATISVGGFFLATYGWYKSFVEDC